MRFLVMGLILVFTTATSALAREQDFEQKRIGAGTLIQWSPRSKAGDLSLSRVLREVPRTGWDDFDLGPFDRGQKLSKLTDLDLHENIDPLLIYSPEEDNSAQIFGSLAEVRRLRFIGVHRFWLRYFRNAFRGFVRKDREAFMDSTSHAGVAARVYNQALEQHSYENALEPWKLKSWKRPGRVLLIGRQRDYYDASWIRVTGSLRLRLIAREFGSRLWSRSKRRVSRRSTGSGLVPYQGRPTLLRARVGLKIGFGYPGIVRRVGLRLSLLFQPWNKPILIPFSVAARHTLRNGDWRLEARLIIFKF